jgi:hypothetical protein
MIDPLDAAQRMLVSVIGTVLCFVFLTVADTAYTGDVEAGDTVTTRGTAVVITQRHPADVTIHSTLA